LLLLLLLLWLLWSALEFQVLPLHRCSSRSSLAAAAAAAAAGCGRQQWLLLKCLRIHRSKLRNQLNLLHRISNLTAAAADGVPNYIFCQL
jgi:hypothetical protein